MQICVGSSCTLVRRTCGQHHGQRPSPWDWDQGSAFLLVETSPFLLGQFFPPLRLLALVQILDTGPRDSFVFDSKHKGKPSQHTPHFPSISARSFRLLCPVPSSLLSSHSLLFFSLYPSPSFILSSLSLCSSIILQLRYASLSETRQQQPCWECSSEISLKQPR